jgi:replicative DNA helicase
MRDIHAGSSVVGADGRAHRVLAVFPQGRKPVYRVRLSDGASAECCDEHLWFTTTHAENSSAGRGGSVKSLAEIRSSLRVGGGEYGALNHRLPLVAPVEFASSGRPQFLAPYLLGLLLGDGGFGSLLRHDTVSVDGIAASRKSTIQSAIEHYGLTTREKFIPDAYLFATASERLDVLRGLFATDGTVTIPAGRTLEFTTSSSKLAEGVVWLVRSLGGLVSHRGQLSKLRISFPNGIVPVSSHEHLARWNDEADGLPGRFVESVEPIGEKECQCILLDSDDHLYVTSDFVVTHNTAFCLNVAAHVGCRAKFNGKRIGVAVFSLEMPKEQLVMRMLSSEARVDSQRIRTGRLVEQDWPKLGHAAGALAEANIHIDDSAALSSLELRAKSRRLASRLSDGESPLGLVIVDYLQLMRGNERVDSREQQIGEISRSLKALAKELNLPVIALSQLNRALEKRPDKRPQLSDLRESGSLEQDADTVIFLYREEVYEREKDDVKGVAEIIVGKQRNGPIGTANAAFLHEFTRFENMARDYGG